MKTWQAILLLCAVGGVLHFWRLGVPREVIFDEVHFGKFVTAYCCTHERFFDIHPPHGKLLIAGTARILGYKGGFDFDHIGEPYGAVSPLPLRFFSALMGILLPLIFYAFLRQLRVSQLFSFLGGLAIVFDNAILVQTRIIALDGLLLAATFGALAAYLLADRFSGWKTWLMFISSGALAGIAAGTKFTGLAALALLGVLVFVRVCSTFFPRILHLRGVTEGYSSEVGRGFLRGLVIFLAAFIIYIAGWWLHFACLTQPGPGDAWGVPSGNFWQDTVKLHKTMLSANYNLTATHPDESPWWSWPVMLTSIFYWSGTSGEVIYFLGNPVVWWGTTVLFLWAFFLARREVWRRGWIPLAGFLVAMLPLIRVPRALFLYHYLTPLLFSLAFGLVWLDQVTRNKKKEIRKKIVVAGAVLLVGGFVLFSPLTYGFQVSSAWLQALYWLPGWR